MAVPISILNSSYSEFFGRQFIELHFFRISYWRFISFPWWCHVYPILHDPGLLVLATVHLSKQSPLPLFTGFLQEG